MDLDDEVYIYLLETDSPKNGYFLYEVYKIHEEGAPVVNTLGSWSPDTNSIIIDDMERNFRRHDLKVSI